MIYLYCRRGSDGARALVNKLNEMRPGLAKRIRRYTPMRGAGFVVNWGDHGGYRGALNQRIIEDKFAELMTLHNARVETVPYSLTRPPHDEWLARTLHHQEARDLLANMRVGDYYVRYVPTEHEFRIHIFHGKSIRAGLKVPRIPNPHPRFRSWTAGWRLDYGGVCQQVLRQSYRDLAKRAVIACGYDFGAVDIGVKGDGSAFVFEVNSAPGLEGETVVKYAQALLNFHENGEF